MLRIEIRDINQCGRHPRDFGYSRTHCSNFAIKNLGHPQEIESPRPPFKTLRGRVCDIFWSPAAPSAVCNIDTTGMGKMLLLRLTLAPAQPTCVCVCAYHGNEGCIGRQNLREKMGLYFLVTYGHLHTDNTFFIRFRLTTQHFMPETSAPSGICGGLGG